MFAYFARSHTGRCVSLFSLAFALPVLAGCFPDFLTSFLPTYGDVRVVGASGENAVLVPRTEDDAFDSFGAGVNPAARDILKLDLASSDLFKPVKVSGATSLDVVASERWIAWLDRDSWDIKVHDSTTGETRTYFDDDDTLPNDVSINHINGDRLLIHRVKAGTEQDLSPSYEFVVLDLNTGAKAVTAASWFYFGSALSGDWLAYMNDDGVNIEPLSLEYVASIDLVNIITSEHKRIAPDIRISGSGAGVFFTDGRVIWQEYRDGGFASKISAYDLASGKSETLIADFDSTAKTRILVDARDGLLLVERTEGDYLQPAKITINTRVIGSEKTTTIGEYAGETTPILGRYFDPEPRLLQGFAVWTNPLNGRLTSYDLSDGVTRVYTLPSD